MNKDEILKEARAVYAWGNTTLRTFGGDDHFTEGFLRGVTHLTAILVKDAEVDLSGKTDE